LRTTVHVKPDSLAAVALTSVGRIGTVNRFWATRPCSGRDPDSAAPEWEPVSPCPLEGILSSLAPSSLPECIQACWRTAHDIGKSRLNRRDRAGEPGSAIRAAGVLDLHCRRHAGDKRNAWRHTVNRDAYRHPLSQGDPRVDRVDLGQSLHAGRGIRHAHASRHGGHMLKDGLRASHISFASTRSPTQIRAILVSSK
jgi:hypothetical protein